MQDTIDDRRGLMAAFREHRTLLHGIARRYVGDDAAADVIQNVFVRVWTGWDRYDSDRGTLRQYLCTVTRGVSLDHVRRNAAQQSRDRQDARDAAQLVENDALRHLIARDTTEAVHRALASISASQRDAINAAFYDGLTYREVAQRLGIPEGTAKSHIRNGLVQLRAHLVRDDRSLALRT